MRRGLIVVAMLGLACAARAGGDAAARAAAGCAGFRVRQPARHRELAAAARPRRLHRRRRRRRDGHPAPAGRRRWSRPGSAASGTTTCCASRRFWTPRADGERDFILFMVQRPDDQVYFYLSTPARRPAEGVRLDPEQEPGAAARARRGGTALPRRGPVLEGPERSTLMEAERINQIASSAHRPAGAVGRAAEVSLTSKASRRG